MRALLPWIALAALGYALLTAFLYLSQARLLYQPDIGGGGLVATPAALGLDFEDVRLRTSDGLTLHGWFVPAGHGQPVVLHLHGNGGNISHRLELLRALHALGLGVLLIDYRGYGLSEGRPSETGTYRDADAAWRHLVEERGYAPGQIVVFGHSLGAAVAAHLARHVRPGALILEAPFTSLPDIAAHHYRFLPVRALVRFRYPTVEHLQGVSAPVLVVHGRHDRIVPFAHGREVWRLAPEPKRLLALDGGHNDVLQVSGAAYLRGLEDFLAAHLATGVAAGSRGR